MVDVDPGAVPQWDAETKRVYDQFLQRGGTPEAWARYVPELPPPPSAQPTKAKPAATDVWQEIKQNMTAAVDAQARASFAWKQRRARKGRQGK